MSSSEPAGAPQGSLLGKLKTAVGLPVGAPSGPKPIQTHPPLQRQDSFPEICSTPSDIGIWEVAHNKARGPDGKFSWRKFFFEAPGRSTPRADGAAVAGSAAASAATGSSSQ